MKTKPREKLNFHKSLYAVIKFLDDTSKSFESIPEIWFINEEKTACYWPPKSGKSVTLRAMNQDIPDWDWEVYECEVVSDGHATYSIASSIVREKCSQKYNTSSADEHLEAAKFRREHPGLIHKGEKSFENLFAKVNSAKKKDDNRESKKENQKKLGKPTEDSVKMISLKASTDTSCEAGNNETNSTSQVNPILKPQSENSDRLVLKTIQQLDSNNSRSGNHSRSPSQNNHPEMKKNDHSDSVRINYSRTGSEYSKSGERSPSNTDSGRSRLSIRSGSIPQNSSPLGSEKKNNNRSRNGSSISSSNSILKCDHQSKRNRRSSGRADTCSSRSSQRTRSRSSQRATPNPSHRDPRSSHHSSIRSSCHSSRHSSRHSRHSSPHLSSHSSRRSSRHSSRHSRHSSRHSSSHSSRRSSQSRRVQSCSSHRSNRHSIRHSSSRSSRRSRSRSRSNIRTHSMSRSNSRLGSVISVRSRTPNMRLARGSGKRFQQAYSSGVGQRSRTNFNHREFSSSTYDRGKFNNCTSTHQRKKSSSRKKVQSSISSRPPKNQLTQPAEETVQKIGKNQLSETNQILKKLIDNVHQLTTTINKNQRRLIENDRRFARMEVTINKSFVLIGDLTNAFETRMSLGQLSRDVPKEIPRGFHFPRLPIKHLKELTILNRDLKNKDFFSFLVTDQKQYCTPSKATDTVIMTAYLKRFISVKVRAKLVLKDLKGQEGLTLYADFSHVYDFLIEVMKAGYLLRKKVLTNTDVHSTLRVVWGRSKQMLNEENRTRR